MHRLERHKRRHHSSQEANSCRDHPRDTTISTFALLALLHLLFKRLVELFFGLQYLFILCLQSLKFLLQLGVCLLVLCGLVFCLFLKFFDLLPLCLHFLSMLLFLLGNVLKLLSTVELPLSDLSQLGLQRLLLFIDLVHFVILPRVLLILQLLVKLLQLALLLLQILLLLVQGRFLPLQCQLLSLEVLRL